MWHSTKKYREHSWRKTVFRKWLHISTKDSDFSTDGDNGSEADDEEVCADDDEESRMGEFQPEANDDLFGKIPSRHRRRNSETLRAQYINTKELRICVGTWNVGGKLPPEDLDIQQWLDTEEPADIYVLGLQEIVPLTAGNIFGAEDSRPAQRWEYIIRETLNSIQSEKQKYKCYSDPPSPTRFKPADDAQGTIDELLPETDSDTDDEVHPLDEGSFTYSSNNLEDTSSVDDLKCIAASSCISNADEGVKQDLDLQNGPTLRRLDRCHRINVTNDETNQETSISTEQRKLTKTLSSSERVGLVWPEQSLDLLAKYSLDSPKSFRSMKSFRAYNSFKSPHGEDKDVSGIGSIPKLSLDAFLYKRKRSPFARIVSKQMVGIFLSIWVRQSLRRHIQNLKVSTVGVGMMGYIGNKGSVSVSMSINQTSFCFICCHLTSGEKNGDELRRNADVQEIHRRTRFNTVTAVPDMGLPEEIYDHERIFWFGDLNYRINLSYERTHELISKKKWSELVERDQLTQELKKGHAFDGWSEGVINFAPTYKYEFNSERYVGEDLKAVRRNPAWCDRVLSLGKDMRLLTYRRSELRLSDHRPVTATFMANVEVFSHRKLQKALTLTDAEVEDGERLSHIDIGMGSGCPRIDEEVFEWGR